MNHKNTIDLICQECKLVKVSYPPWRAKQFLKNGWHCKSCASKIKWRNHSIETKNKIKQSQINALTEWRKQNPERLREIGKIRRSKVKISGKELRTRQQESIKNNPDLYEKYCQKRKQIAENFHKSMTDVDREIHYAKVFKNTGKSKAEDDFFEILKNHGLFFNRNKVISGFIVDGVDDQKKIIVEFYGDSFHCNPQIYQDPNKYCSWLRRSVKQQWDRDRRRISALYKNGYSVIIVWEKDWKLDQSKQIRSIKDALYIC